jgi:flavodoxin
MRYVVAYYSESGNTEELAERIYQAIDAQDKEIVDLSATSQIPYADIYFVGFPIHQNNCSMKVINAFEQMEGSKIALFATCGLSPTEHYKEKLSEALEIWLPDDAECLGMYLCQGKTTELEKNKFYRDNPEYQDRLEAMFEEGDTHPNRDDLDAAEQFVERIC